MTHLSKITTQKSKELSALFLTLDASRQDSALYILKALEFAQSILYKQVPKKAGQNVSPV